MKVSRFKTISTLLLLATVVACASVSRGRAPSGRADTTFNLRVMAANLTSGNKQSYDPGHGGRIIHGLQPDVVLIQEFRYGDQSEESMRKFVNSAAGEGSVYVRESTEGDSSAPIPNGIISKYPIVESGEWEDEVLPNRDFLWAKIDLPGPRDLYAVSLHLYNKKAKGRADEAKVLVEKIKTELLAKTPNAYVVLGGDLNAVSPSEEVISILSELVAEDAQPTDTLGRKNTNRTRSKAYDWVLASLDLRSFQIPTFGIASGLVFDSSSFETSSVKLESIPGVQPDDSIAEGMQHFAVVKDFRIPIPEVASQP